MIYEEKQNTGTNIQRYGGNFLFRGRCEYFLAGAAVIRHTFQTISNS
jgi:hypothetical protein